MPGYRWAEVEPDAINLDSVPMPFLPEAGCPQCGAVWESVVALGCRSEIPYNRARFVFDHWADFPGEIGVSFVAHVSAVMLQCFAGHYSEYDGVRLLRIPSWSDITVSFGPAYALVGGVAGRRARRSK